MAGELIVGLDIGTTKMCAVVGELQPGAIEIIGIGSHPSEGLRKGVVINIEKTVNSIKEALEEAETMAGCEISSVYAGIAGGHIKGFNSHGVIALKEREVTRKDIERVIEAASAVAIPLDREVIHVLTQEFIVDDQGSHRISPGAGSAPRRRCRAGSPSASGFPVPHTADGADLGHCRARSPRRGSPASGGRC